MTYKARRTRDLQGEVKAGTGISVTVSVKPDGTKEYTITNGDPASAITVSGEGLSLIANILSNTMAARMGWNDTTGALEWYDDNGDPFVKLKPTGEVLISDADDGAGFFIKQLAGDTNKLISGDIQIAEDQSSTEGVSLQTLADMSNSIAIFDVSTGSHKENGTNYFITETFSTTDIQTIGSFYQNVETQYIIDGTNVNGINILHSGIYRVSTRIELDIPTTTTINTQLYLSIIKIDENGNYEDLRSYAAFSTQTTTTQYSCTFNIDTLIKADSGDVISFMVINQDINVTDLYTLAENPLFAIQKVR